ncbi:Capsule polysaccharide biosynthesis protein [Komagataeibacter xylinus E25]|nr:Capsule polysaccharide biosynthesis protein [Komagataeibacter xylinus E25]
MWHGEAANVTKVLDDPVLLRPPPLHRHMPVLGEQGGGMGGDPDGIVRMLAARVGGNFWGKAPSFTRPVIVTATDREQRKYGQGRLARLLDCVLRTVPARNMVLVVRHPHGTAARMARYHGIACLTEPVDPHAILDAAQEIHSLGTGDIVRLAALRGLRAWRYDSDLVACPVTYDHCVRDLTVRTGYTDPFTHRPVPLGRIIDILSLWRNRIMMNREIAVCVGMAVWKRKRIGEFLAQSPGYPAFRRRAAEALGLAVRKRGAIVGWATRLPKDMAQIARESNVPLWRMEDGFVRSVGLGSDLCVPCSIFVDRRGIYYDPSGPSDLEHILATTTFDAPLLARARRLIHRMVDGGVTKYGRTSDTTQRPDWQAGNRRVILVPGQVDDDLSVRRGGGAIQGNQQLLRAVRERNPDAFVIYRPHPDVDAGHRAGHLQPAEIMKYANHVSRGGSITTIMMQVDEIHTLTSLAGFEALLRNRTVVTYGVPFYSGWGLTTDLGNVPCARRNRSLSVDALVAGTLLLYPLYLDPVTGLPCEIETLLDRFGEGHIWRISLLTRLRRLQGKLTSLCGRRNNNE